MTAKLPSRLPASLAQLRPWTFLTNHAQALLALGRDPDATVTDIAAAAQISERTAYRILADLQREGYVQKRKVGRRNRYDVRWDVPIGDPIVEDEPIRELLWAISQRTTSFVPASTGNAVAAFDRTA